MARFVVAAVGEIPPGGRKIVEVGGLSIGIFNLHGEYFALRNRCPHQGGALCQGNLWGDLQAAAPGEIRYSRGGEILACLWHGWEFDIRTGQSLCDPKSLRVRRYRVEVEPGAAITEQEIDPKTGRVKGPYVAETFAVTTEDSYVVVDLEARAGGAS